jgi:3,4-dihydroxy 2-butanone 4-phosphate synthase / GTP cyclohydrolase II
MSPFVSVKEAIKQIKKGGFVIIGDDPNRENEGDFFIPAQTATPEKINFMLKEARGLLCVPMEKRQAAQLNLPLMVPPHENTEITKINFGISVNGKKKVGSGISAFDRAATIKILANPKSHPADITRPGHVFPLIAHEGGLKARRGQTEGAVLLAKLAGFSPVGVLCEILKANGHMARLPDLVKVSNKFNIPIVTIADLAEYQNDDNSSSAKYSSVVKTASSLLPTVYGKFQILVYRSVTDNLEHVALVMGKIKAQMLVRIHSQCLTGDTLGSLTCDCGQQLKKSLELIKKAKSGVLLYLNQEGRGIGLTNKIKAYAKQNLGMDTVEANQDLGFGSDERDYKIAADILKDLKIQNISLLTNNPDKVHGLQTHGIKVLKQLPLEIKPNTTSRKYLSTKKMKLGHNLNLV